MSLSKALFIIFGENKKKSKELEVLFNPSEYQLSSQVNYADLQVPGLNSSIVQFIAGQSDRLSMTLHLDTYTKTQEISIIPFMKPDDPEDVRDTVLEMMKLLDVDGKLHAPPLSQFSWGSVNFKGVVDSIQCTYTMFTEEGIPVRARLEVSMRSVREPGKDLRSDPRESPDRTKQRTLVGNMQLWQMAAEEYGDPALWREIARANSIDNPRKLPAGQALRVPALD